MSFAKIVQLSDLHLVAPGRALFGAVPRERLAQAIDAILRDHADAALCLLTGDLADADHDAAYRDLAAMLARLPMPVLPMMGNHDDREALRRAFPPAFGDFPFLQTAADTPAGRFLLLDTADAGRASGILCAERLRWLESRLAEDTDRPLFLAMHHPPLAVGIPSMDQYALRNPEDLWTVIEPHRARLRHLFLGHLHRPIGGSWRGIPISCTASPNHQVALDLASLPASGDVPACQEPPGFSVALIDDGAVVIHHQAFPDAERFFI